MEDAWKDDGDDADGAEALAGVYANRLTTVSSDLS